MESYQSQITFLYFDDFEGGKHFLSEILKLKPVYTPDWAEVYQASNSAYIGAVDAKRGSISSTCRGGFLVSLTVSDVLPYYDRFKTEPSVKNLTEIKIFEDIGVKSFFFKGPEGYDFEIQQFTGPQYDFTKTNDESDAKGSVAKDSLTNELISAERKFNLDAARFGAKGWSAHFLPDGKMLTKSGRPITGIESIESAMIPFFKLDQLVFTWEPTDAQISQDGTMGYTYGTYRRTYKNSEGDVLERGMYMTVWKRNANNDWKVAVDIGN